VYKVHEKVPLYTNKVGPFHNPSETYEYYRLPFCPPADGLKHKAEDLGEVLIGDRLVGTPYEVSFRVDHENEKLCSKDLTEKDLVRFRKAVKDDYYFQMYYDDLPLWGFIGKVEKILRPGQPARCGTICSHTFILTSPTTTIGLSRSTFPRIPYARWISPRATRSRWSSRTP